mgnify:CR=1 FL=1
MVTFLYKLSYYGLIFIITYLLFVFPPEVIEHLILNSEIFNYKSLITTFSINLLILIYFKTFYTNKLLKLFVNEGIGIGFISFWITTLALIFSFLITQHQSQIGYISIFLIISITIYSYLNGRKIKLKFVNLNSNLLNSKSKIIFISDIHLGTNSIKHVKKIFNMISKVKYDFILIGGDLIDSSEFNLSDLEIFKNFKKPIFFCTGNHDYYIKRSKEKLDHLSNYNIKYLNNCSQLIKDFNIIGINDNQSVEKQGKIAKRYFNKDKFNIFLTHKPSLFKILDCPGLMLSGHTHNGQIFPFNYFVKIKFKHVYGFFKKINTDLYVSSGSGCWGPRMRLGSNNEIVVLGFN